MLLRLGQRVAFLEKRLAKCRDVCINHRDELAKELKKQFVDVIHYPIGCLGYEDIEFFCSLSPEDQTKARKHYHNLEF